RQGLVRGLPKLKFEKDHLCSACAMGKSKKKSHKPKSEDTDQEKLYLLDMDLCGPMCVKSVNRKKYILVIVNDYPQFTWVKFLRKKDEAPDFIIKFLNMIQIGISYETSIACSPQQNGVIERRNRTLIEAARTMLIYARTPLFLWAEAVATASRQGLVRGLPKLKFEKDHLCSACAMGKSKKKSHKPKSEDTDQEKLYLLDMDLCGPMCVKSVNGKKYILVIVNDYPQFTWVKCLRKKDEAPDFIIKFLNMIQVRLKVSI
nr:hypothetical protein [Tanacetum cinerariifolium]